MESCSINEPALWRAHFPWPRPDGNKYDRGHAFIMGGPLAAAGAAKLAAHAALRVGAGLVSILCAPAALLAYAPALQAVMTRPLASTDALAAMLSGAHSHPAAMALGPACGVNARTRGWVETALAAAIPTVLDADALSVFANDAAALAQHITAPTILTPHAGEYARLFGQAPNHADAARHACAAAARSGAVAVLKGPRTAIAAPDGRCAVTRNAPAFLATAGSGDVLTGLCAGLLAQSMPAYEAACAAVWLHAETARGFGPGLTAEDIAPRLPLTLSALLVAWEL